MNIERDSVVLVLGATGNLGQACSGLFAELGARVVAIDRSEERLQALFAGQNPDRCLLLGEVDLTREDGVDEAVAEVVGRFGRIDAVINTVGAFRGGQPVHSEDPKTWHFLMDVNLYPALLMARAVLPHMRARRSGRIVNVASRNAFRGSANYAAYSAAKAALLRLTEALAEENGALGITANCVVPGTIDTPQNRESMPEADFSKWVSAREIAEVMAFLVSPAARSINGAAVPVYGQS